MSFSLEIQFGDPRWRKVRGLSARLTDAAARGLRAGKAPRDAALTILLTGDRQVKALNHDFRGKAKHLEFKARDHQPAMLCTLVLTENTDSKGVKRYPVGSLPVLDPQTGETLIDELGRRSYTTSIAYGPTIGKNIALAYLPWSHCQVGRKLNVEYFGETYPVEVAGVGYKPLYDPENLKPRT